MAVKYVFVTGGVVSGLGKGITAASLGRLLKSRGYFVTMQTFDQFAMPHEEVEDRMKFVKEEMTVKIMSYKGKIFDLEPPLFVELEVTETEPGFKGNTSTGATKPCTVETGAQINVPLFVEIGDKIQIDTRTGEYLKRV